MYELHKLFIGLLHTPYDIDCREHGDTYINLFDENECRNSKALFPNARYIKTLSSPSQPNGCFIDGQEIYWNTSPTGVTNSKIRSICKTGK